MTSTPDRSGTVRRMATTVPRSDHAMEPSDRSEPVRVPITVILLTYNEEVNVEHCLRSIEGWTGEIIVVDSFSTDRTLDICRRYTDRIYQHPFENHGKQVNWALDCVPISHEWVMQLDADEIVTRELADELCRKLPMTGAEVTGLYAKRRVYFMDRWIRHGDQYPMWLLRIFRRGRARNEEFEEDRVVLLDGRPGYLECDFIDHNRKGLTFWVEKHCRWSSTEARDMLALADGESDTVSPLRINPRLIASQDQRRRWLKKNIYAHLPLFFRAFMYFLYRYVVRLGFMDGHEGLMFHFLQGCWYRFMVDARIHEGRKASNGRPAGEERGPSRSGPMSAASHREG